MSQNFPAFYIHTVDSHLNVVESLLTWKKKMVTIYSMKKNKAGYTIGDRIFKGVFMHKKVWENEQWFALG